MEGNLRGGGGGGCSEVSTMHVKTEAVDETSALGLGSRESPAPCGDTACRGGGGGGGDQTAEQLADATANPVLLYSASTDRFFTTSGDGKTYLKIAPASAMPAAPSEKALPSGSDFSSKAVLCLIEAVGRRWGLYETRERSQLFQSVQDEMASKGHVLPVEKIRRKWNNLIVTYKRVKDRSRETGHAKTSWEFFDLMDATLCDTVGTQVVGNKRHRVPAPPGPLAKIAAKPQFPPPAIIRPNGDFASTGGADSVGLISSAGAVSSMAPATASPTNAPELKPLMMLNSDVVATSVHPAAIAPSPSFISSPCFTETASTPPSLGPTGNGDLGAVRKAPAFSPAVGPFRLNNRAPPSHDRNLLGLSSSLASSASAAAAPQGSEGPSRRGGEERSGVALFQEVVKRQEEQAYLDRVARRRVEAREKRRERREVRMAESLGRMATALELLSSKQDTVIALLQRLAERK
ncbi:hypothetical protein EYF80_036554 [Liparis tanakae]|uniref:Myb/SANT-like DNA-binding domain-containing protein n=1 Tax=Liparis tanakae TaxID=230148 RepID=A0A4Z2GK01_9TELE|nr:hypothetical protein EYF80_036554 [Liparis tanakae]